MKAFFSLVLVILLVCAWCPWFEMADAQKMIATSVFESQSTLQTGCVLTIDKNSIQKIPFGYTESVAYNCTFNTDFLTDGKNTVFAFFFGNVINVPHPIIK